MPDISNYLQKRFLKVLATNTTLTIANVYVGLMLTPGSQYYSGKEPNDPVYSRQKVVLSEPAQDADNPGYMVTTNTEDILFPAAEASWGTIPYFGLFTTAAATANLLFSGTFQEPVKVGRWDAVVIPAGGLSIRVG